MPIGVKEEAAPWYADVIKCSYLDEGMVIVGIEGIAIKVANVCIEVAKV